MELEELQKIWHSPNQNELYTINMKGMSDHIYRKKEKALHLINVSELLLIAVNLAAGIFIILFNRFQPPSEVFMYILGAWMLGAALYALLFRIRRTNDASRFDRSVHGDLNYAVSTATFQVRLSQIMRWNVVPIAILTTLGMWGAEKSMLFICGTIFFFALAFYFSGWEHNVYVKRKEELEKLRDDLLSEEQI